MYKNGIKGRILVDNYIPTLKREPCFSTTHGNELWVIIIEKVWAKLHGDFVRIIAGMPHETFRDLTGAPSFQLDTAQEDIWDIIKFSDDSNYMMAAGCVADGDD